MNSEKYFVLHDSCKLVDGAVRGAIYSLKSGDVYSINKNARIFLNSLLQGNLIHDLVAEYGNLSKEYIEFLHQLERLELGYFSDSWNKSKDENLNVKYAMPLNFIWLELTSRCNNKCIHCYSESSKTINNDKLNLNDWKSIIKQGADLGCRNLQFIGGEPLLYKNIKDLIIFAQNQKYQFIEVFTNATLIDDNWVEFFSKYGINIATSLYSDNLQTHDRITQRVGSHKKTVSAIKKLIESNVKVRVASILMKQNENEVNSLMKYLSTLHVNYRYPDIVRPTGRGNNKELLPKTYDRGKTNKLFRTNYRSYIHNKNWNSCLAGKIVVTSNGNVYPCIFLRTESFGDIRITKLKDIIEKSAIKECWSITLDKVEGCRKCEYRYACFDCRPLAQANDSEKKWLAKPQWCQYEPTIGKENNTADVLEIKNLSYYANSYENNVQLTGEWDCHPRCTPSSGSGGPGCYPSCNPKCGPDTCSPNCDPACNVTCSPEYCNPSCKPNISSESDYDDCGPNSSGSGCGPEECCFPRNG